MIDGPRVAPERGIELRRRKTGGREGGIPEETEGCRLAEKEERREEKAGGC